MGEIQNMLSESIKKELEIKKVNITKVIEQYARGIAKEHIRVTFGITKEQLNFIIEYYGGKGLEKVRNIALNKWGKTDTSNPLGRPKVDNLESKERKKITLEEAIKNVEGEER